MFVHQTRLPHLLSPSQYVSGEQFERERKCLFQPGWHVVAVLDDLRRDGDFLTVELLGVPLLVRNFGGSLHAFLNVCTHRHCLISSQRQGHQPKFVCQYHGWEYHADGSTGRIPDAGSFRPLPGGPERLHKYPLEVLGPLVFVSLNADAPPLLESFGPLAEPLEEFPGDRWKQAAAWQMALPVNWKVVVENTIESYHVPLIHPQTLVQYTAEESTVHELHPNGSVMRSLSVIPWPFRLLARCVLPWLQSGLTLDRYRLFHVFPALFVIRIDATLQVMTVVPTSPTECALVVRIFSLRSAREHPISRLCTWFWGRLKTMIIRMILAEDIKLLPDIQRGMAHSPFTGTISTREELIFAFQDDVRRRCGLTTDQPDAPVC